MQGVIGGKIGPKDTINVDFWYNDAYELASAGWKLKELAEMSDILHNHVNVVIQPRTHIH